MRLRARLAATVVAAALPLLGGVVWMRGEVLERDADRSLREFALARMESGGRERCEADPAFFAIVSPGPGASAVSSRGPSPAAIDLAGPTDAAPLPPPLPPEGGAGGDVTGTARSTGGTELWAYGADFVSRNKRAPEIPAELAAAIRDGEPFVGAPHVVDVGGGARVVGRQLLVRTPWPGGPAAFVLVRRADPIPPDFGSFAVWSAAAIAVAMAGVVAIAAGFVVRRITRLTTDVRRSAAERYASPVPVTGSDEIADLARAFDAAGAEIRGHIDELGRREETLRTFLANTTHDVMTPLTVLQGHLSSIRRCAAEGRAVDPELANAAAEEAHYLASLVHNLSAVAKLDAGLRQVQLAPVNVNDLVQRVVERHWSLASPRAIEVAFAVPESVVWFDADLTLFEQAVSNVVGNAVRYNRPGGHVAVLLEEPAKGAFSIRVIDDGPGVTDEQMARLGTREYRTDEARRRNPEGTGLGLDIVRRVASFHRLDLAFRRSEHGGLEVELRGLRGAEPKQRTA